MGTVSVCMAGDTFARILGPEVHPVSYTMGTGLFLGVKRPWCGLNHPPPSSAEVKERVELYLCCASVPSWQIIELNLVQCFAHKFNLKKHLFMKRRNLDLVY
jgi:hypothetical protein